MEFMGLFVFLSAWLCTFTSESDEHGDPLLRRWLRCAAWIQGAAMVGYAVGPDRCLRPDAVTAALCGALLLVHPSELRRHPGVVVGGFAMALLTVKIGLWMPFTYAWGISLYHWVAWGCALTAWMCAFYAMPVEYAICTAYLVLFAVAEMWTTVDGGLSEPEVAGFTVPVLCGVFWMSLCFARVGAWVRGRLRMKNRVI
ncbi:hypothetical protein GCM10025857_38740 [Alicyclobacillus contaminans]|uniref:hypothetical protein n=1 Tax=Alicyclobacillus contaminans TaxID=392016 RepID=UPI00047A95D5|nr:hypothetical protein [Alicyclobacillus contaminans]GMA52517.1 hypothetical protein GCM10025857_38740 [Alicyclobacillus contaminans]